MAYKCPKQLNHYAIYRKHLRLLCADYGVDKKTQTPSLLYMQIDSLCQKYAYLDYLMNFVAGRPGSRKDAEDMMQQLRRDIEKAVTTLAKLSDYKTQTGPTTQGGSLRAAAAAHTAGQ